VREGDDNDLDRHVGDEDNIVIMVWVLVEEHHWESHNLRQANKKTQQYYSSHLSTRVKLTVQVPPGSYLAYPTSA